MYTSQQSNTTMNPFQQNQMGFSGNDFNRAASFGNTGADFARDPSFNFNATPQQPNFNQQPSASFYNNGNQQPVQQMPNMMMSNNYSNPMPQQMSNINMGINNMPQLTLQNNVGSFGNPSQPYNNQPQLPQPLLDAILRSLSACNIRNIRSDSGLTITIFENRLVVPLSQFFSFLENLLRLNREQAQQVAQIFLYKTTQNMGQNYLIDIEAFEKVIYSSNAPQGVQSQLINMNAWQQQRSAYDILKKVNDQVRQYLLFQNGDLLKLFIEADVNKDNFITLNELGYVLEKLGFSQQNRLNPQEIQSLLSIFDKNGDGRISYSELCQQFADLTNVKAIKDPNFWAYYIFQNIRTVCQYQNRSLAQLFNISGQFRGWNDRSMKIPRDQFLNCLAQNGIPLQLDHEQKLFDLLQTSDSMFNGDVDFLHFSELIGIETQNQEINYQVTNGRFAPNTGNVGENSRKFFRSINKVMLQQGLEIKNLERLLQNVEMTKNQRAMGLQGLIDLNEFISTIKHFNGQLDVNLIREVGTRFSQNNLVNYNEFINTLKFEQQKFHIFNAVFSALQASLTQHKARSLRDLFTAVQPQFHYSPQIDITTLDTVIKSGSKIPMKQSDLQMIVLEYATSINSNQVDFQAFEKDFMEFMGQEVGQSITNTYNTEFNAFLSHNPPVTFGAQPNYKRPLPMNSQDAMRRIALTYEQDPSISINSVIARYQVNPQTGSLATTNFQSLLYDLFKLRPDDIQNLVSHYDQSGRMEIRIQDFLEDLKDFVGNVGKRMEIINLTTKFGGSGGASQMNEASLLATYGKDIEEMIKGVMISGKDTFQLFSMYSQQPGRLTLSKMDFSGALISLDLSRQLNEQDLSAFFAALDLSGQNLIQVASIDGLFKKYLQQRPKQAIEDEIIEKLIRTFNGDLNFLQRELSKIDPMGRGIIDTPLFVQGIKSYLPQTVNINNKDLILVAKRFESSQLGGGKLQLSQFLDELRFIMNRKGISEQVYNMHLMGNAMGGGLTPGGPAMNQITQGNTNPMLGMGSRNTRSEQLNPHMDQQRSIFRTKIEDQYFEDLVKATYLKGETVYKYFANKASSQDESLPLNVFSQAILTLGVNWNIMSTNTFFNEIDVVMNRVNLGKVTAQQLDEAVNLGCKKTINEMSEDILKIIVEQAVMRELDFKQLVRQQDIGKKNMITVDAFLDIVLNRLKVPSLVKNDVMFLAKKYIRALANNVCYQQLLEDFDMISKGSVSAAAGFKHVCSYIRKACLVHHNITEVQQYFKQHCSLNTNDALMSFIEFQKAINGLYLVPEICQQNQIQGLFNEIDTAKTQRVTMDQIASYIRKMSSKQTRELQDEVLDEIALKMKTTAKDVILANIFKFEDPGDRAKISPMSFANITMQSFKGVKELDVKLLSKRYEEQGQVNYKKFIQEVQLKMQNATHQSNLGKDQFGLQPGVHGMDPNSEIGVRLKQILVKINDFVVIKRIQLANLLSPNETAGGLLPYDIFYQQLRNLNITDVSDEDVRFLAENYLKVTTSVNMRGGQVVDYLKFLGDLKIHGVATKSMTTLTNEQKKVFSLLGTSIKNNNAMNGLTTSLLDSDPTLRGYLPSATLVAIFRKNGVRDITDQQFTTVFTAIDKNSQGDSSYKQLLELILGGEETQRLFAGAAMGVRPQIQTQAIQFAMPIRPTNPSSKIMGEIGMKIIRGGKNYEEEFRQRIGQQVAQSDQPSASVQIVYQVLDACCQSQKLTNDERTTLEAYLLNIKDPRGNIQLFPLLQGLGLPPQTLGIRGTKAAPRKILSLEERQKAQKIIFELRKQLTYLKKTPQDVFEKCKASPSDVSIPEQRFRMAIQNSPEFGQVGLQVSDELIRILIYYLQQEVPGEVSYKKLYFAFVQTESEQPLQQEGIDEIKKYEQLIREQANKGTPIEILELVNFMRQQGMGMSQVFKLAQTGFIQRSEFENSLKEVGFKSRDIMKLIEVLDTKGNRQNVSLDRLNEYIQKAASSGKRGANGKPTINMQQAREQYQGFDPKVRQILSKISESLKKNGLSINKLFDHLDANRDGSVDREEFVNSMPIFMQIPGVDMRDYAIIFNALDINNDGVLSLNEFGMFLEGAKLDQIQRIREIDPKIIEDMNNEVRQLFATFDQNKDGFITADEIKLAMLAIGRNVTMEEAQAIIRSVDSNGDGRLDQREFCELMLQKMKDELLSQEDNIEDLRAHFLDADIDHSGTLSVNEIYGVLLKMGADLTLEELIHLMNEIDVDRNGELDIDEFVALMTVTGNEMEFSSETSKKTLQSIRKCRKLNPLDFLKQFKSMPISFIPSFLGEKWKSGKNLPSSAFMPTIDPKTMLYKDMMPVVQENLPPNIQAKKQSHPKLRPQNIEIGCEINFEEATGVPLPQANEKFDRSQIVKRAVRLGLYDSLKKEYYANTAQVNVLYQGSEAEDIWKFQTMRDNSLNPVLFRAANGFCRNNCFIVFELVIYVKFGNDTAAKVTEMSCGWCSLELKDPNVFQRQTQLKLPIHGGSPQVNQDIDSKDVHTTRTGLKHSIQSMFNSKIESQLTINLKPHTRLDDDNRFHMSLIPQTCFIQKRLLYFVSGFRNYAAQKLLKQMAAGSMVTFKQPEGDALISTFQKVLDCPDIAEQFVKIWSEDFLPNLDKMNIEHVIQKTKECLRKIYPVLYAEEFGLNLHTVTDSAIGDQYLMRKREELLNSALKHGNPASKATTQPLEQLTSFRPFSIRENDFDVWYSSTAKSDQILQQYGELGVIKPPTPKNFQPNLASGPAQGFNQMGMMASSTGFNPRNTGMSMMSNQPYQQQQHAGLDLRSAFNNNQLR